MKALTKISLVCFLLISTGCVTSLYPLYTEDEVIFDPNLLGFWVSKDSAESWEITKTGKKQYDILYTDEEGKTGAFTAHFLKFGGHTFLDLTPVKPSLSQNDFYQSQFLTTHTFLLVSETTRGYQISYLEPKWLEELLARDPKLIRHERVSGEILLTASPEELQKFIRAHLNSAFSDPVEITRKK